MEAVRRAETTWQLDSACSTPDGRARFDAAVLIKWLAGFLTGAQLACGVWLMVRRLTGSFAAPLDGGALVVVGALAVLWAAAARLLWRHAAKAPNRSWRERAIEWAPTVALVLIATAAVMPGSSPAGVVLLWTMIVVEEVGAGLISRRTKLERSRFAGRIRPRNDINEVTETDDASLASELRQRQTRKQTADGSEVIDGIVRVVFATGQRVAIEHIAFCPMLARIPTVSATILDELEGAARATHVYRYGARLEVKMREPCDEAVEVAVQYGAHG